MTLLEAYLFLLTDSFISGLILPAKHAIVLPAMRIFGGYNHYFTGFIYTIGVTIAACLNWVLGKILRSLKKDMPDAENNKQLDKIFIFLRTYGYWGGLFGFISSLGPLIIVLAGLVQTSFKRTIALVFIANLLAYCVL